MLTGTIRHLGRDMFSWWRIFMSLCLVDNPLRPCVAEKDEGDP